MKIKLCILRNNKTTQQNIALIKTSLRQNQTADLIVFTGACLQGSKQLKWQVDSDEKLALSLLSPEISALCTLAKTYHTAISFCFYERALAGIYLANLFISAEGKRHDLYRATMPTWKDASANHIYREGTGFHLFHYAGYQWVIALSDELSLESHIRSIQHLKPDILLCPLNPWTSDQLLVKQPLEIYQKRLKRLNCPYILIAGNDGEQVIHQFCRQGHIVAASLLEEAGNVIDLS